MSPLLTARELAVHLDLMPATILDKWERGEIPGYKIPPWKKNAPVRFDLDEVLASSRRPGDGGTTPVTPSNRPAVAIVSPSPVTPIRGGTEDA